MNGESKQIKNKINNKTKNNTKNNTKNTKSTQDNIVPKSDLTEKKFIENKIYIVNNEGQFGCTIN